MGLIEIVAELWQSENIRHAGSFEVFRVAAVVVKHHPQTVASGLSAEVFIVGFLKIRRLLEQADLAVSALLAGVAFLFFKVRPSVLIQSGVARVVFPVAVFGDDRGEADVFEFLGAAVLARRTFDIESLDPTSGQHLVAGIFLAGGGDETFDKIRGHFGFIERDLPHHRARVIPVATDQLAGGFDAVLVKWLGRGIKLPTHDRRHRDKSKLIAGVHERRALRIVREPHIVEASLFDEVGIAILRIRRHRIADEGMLLVAIDAAEEQFFAIDQQAPGGEADAPDADALTLAVHDFPAGDDGRFEMIQMRRARAPELGRDNFEGGLNRHLLSGGERFGRRFLFHDFLAREVGQAGDDGK